MSPLEERRALIVLLSVIFLMIAGFGLVIPLLPFFAQAYGAPAWQVTLLFSAFSFGQFLGEPFWGRGYATEAAHALVDLAFRATEIVALHAACRVINPASRRVIHKCGFQYAGQGMLNSIVAGQVPVERYRLDRKTWASLRSWAHM